MTPRPPRAVVRRAAVLGAGNMGAQIAALLAGQGIPCDLLDLPGDPGPGRNRLAEEGKRRLTRLQPSPLYTRDALDLIQTGNFADDLERLRQADWVLEAIVERLEPKRQLWGQVAAYLKPEAIASSNTSGLPIASIAQALPPPARRRFLGTHFFNPPRYLRLLEVIPTADTDPAVTAAMARFAEEVLGKGVVIARDVPNFVANRVGCYGLLATLEAMEAHGLAPDEVDAVTGPLMGRPGSATFRTLDLVGIDVFIEVCDNLRANVPDPQEQAAYRVPDFMREMIRRGWTGDKGGQGFYRRVTVKGETQVLTLDPRTLEYRPRKRLQAPSLAALGGVEDTRERLRNLVRADDVAGRFAWRALSRVQAYSAAKVGEIAGDLASIDRAMRWGFGWELGPFETWDALGVAETGRRMERDGLALPAWVRDLAARGDGFYRFEQPRRFQATRAAAYAPVQEDPRVIDVQRLRAEGRLVAGRPGASLYDLGDGVAFLDFHSPKQAIGPDMMEMLEEAARRAVADFRGLVIGGHVRPNFCVGANVGIILMLAQEGEWQELDAIAHRFQQSMLRLKRLPVPVVVAPYGMTLGGGAEVALSAARVVAAAETYVGLVEVGVGVIPGGSGCTEMLLRALEALPGGPAASGLPREGAPSLVPDPDPNGAVARVFETIGTAKVSTSAAEARGLGFLRAADVIVANQDLQLHVARQAVLALDAQGYAPPPPARIPILGAGARALLEMGAQTLVWAGQASEHDLLIARKLARVLTGGDGQPGALADEQHFLDLERESFVSLCGEPKTQARMQHLLQTGRVLRN